MTIATKNKDWDYSRGDQSARHMHSKKSRPNSQKYIAMRSNTPHDPSYAAQDHIKYYMRRAECLTMCTILLFVKCLISICISTSGRTNTPLRCSDTLYILWNAKYSHKRTATYMKGGMLAKQRTASCSYLYFVEYEATKWYEYVFYGAYTWFMSTKTTYCAVSFELVSFGLRLSSAGLQMLKK